MSVLFRKYSHDTYSSQTRKIRVISWVRAIIPARLTSGFPRWNWGTVVVGVGKVGTTEYATEIQRYADVPRLNCVGSRHSSSRGDCNSDNGTKSGEAHCNFGVKEGCKEPRA